MTKLVPIPSESCPLNFLHQDPTADDGSLKVISLRNVPILRGTILFGGRVDGRDSDQDPACLGKFARDETTCWSVGPNEYQRSL